VNISHIFISHNKDSMSYGVGTLWAIYIVTVIITFIILWLLLGSVRRYYSSVSYGMAFFFATLLGLIAMFIGTAWLDTNQLNDSEKSWLSVLFIIAFLLPIFVIFYIIWTGEYASMIGEENSSNCFKKPYPCACKKNPCICMKDPCACKRDPCVCKKTYPCACKRDPCVCKKTYPCACKSDPCVCKKTYPCACKSDPCVCMKDQCACKRNPCVCMKDQCACKRNPCVCMKDQCACKRNPCICGSRSTNKFEDKNYTKKKIHCDRDTGECHIKKKKIYNGDNVTTVLYSSHNKESDRESAANYIADEF
jgi:hypothetical protein